MSAVKIGSRNYTYSMEDTASLVSAALNCIAESFHIDAHQFTATDQTKVYFQLRLALNECEVFSVAFLDNKHHLIECREMFHGTIDAGPVYPREIVRACIETYACAVVLAHNHPSGDTTPSEADRRVTAKVTDALSLIDVRVLDHIVVGADAVSMKELGLI